MFMTCDEIKQKFLSYFAQLGHEIVAGSSLLPINDNSLLFTNAGMVQFKEVFLGKDNRSYKSAVSVQRCLRAGGKHNDLDQVGYTARHHTFFEMLGNFSFSAYGKREAIQYAWTFLTDILQIPPTRLWITVYKDDHETANIWLQEILIDPQRLSYCDQDNFWMMGDIGPCGPSTEIFYDHGESILGGPPGSSDSDGDRYVEIWNIVFMQYSRNLQGELSLLPNLAIDTGMGLERIAAVMQNVHNNYEIDVFVRILQNISKIIGKKNINDPSLRVISDHIRAIVFLLADNVVPSNEGRGYVLRRIIRRAVRHGHKLGCQEAFLYRLVPIIIEVMGTFYPYLSRQENMISDFLREEEELFLRTLHQGSKIFYQYLTNMSGKIFPGELAFLLYDTYGFPPDLTVDMCREHGLEVDMQSFDSYMAAQRKRAQASNNFKIDLSSTVLKDCPELYTSFTGYDNINYSSSKVIGLFSLDSFHALDKVEEENKEFLLVVNYTPFYAESGGQVGDIGEFVNSITKLEVLNTYKSLNHFHHVRLLKGSISINDLVDCMVNKDNRLAIQANHSATHLLHAALRNILGEGVQQKGSLVASDRLRFDFSYNRPLTDEQISSIENMVNYHIRENHLVKVELVSLENAKQRKVMALFEDKYDDEVRVLTMGDFSAELCGGTHVTRTGDIGFFKIISESAIATGIRRIEAVTGDAALKLIQNITQELNIIAKKMGVSREGILLQINKMKEEKDCLLQNLRHYQHQLGEIWADNLLKDAKCLKQDILVISGLLPKAENDFLRLVLDSLRAKKPNSIIFLAGVYGDKVNLLASVYDVDLSKKVNARDLLQYVANKLGGKGGGKAEFAQGSANSKDIDQALSSIYSWIEEKL